MSSKVTDVCENNILFNSLIKSYADNIDIKDAQTLYENAKFYYSTNELNGALVSYSCCAVLLNSLVTTREHKMLKH